MFLMQLTTLSTTRRSVSRGPLTVRSASMRNVILELEHNSPSKSCLFAPLNDATLLVWASVHYEYNYPTIAIIALIRGSLVRVNPTLNLFLIGVARSITIDSVFLSLIASRSAISAQLIVAISMHRSRCSTPKGLVCVL